MINYAFEDRVGAFPGELQIEVDGAIPTQQPIRNVPFAMEKQFKSELRKMVRDGIIEKVEEPCSWLNSFVIETKTSGGICICLDPKPSNKVIKNYHYQIR